jgi:signal transduction histidine kinase
VSSAPRNVFLLFDERLDFPGLASLDADLVGTLGSNSTDRIEVYREAMDLSRFGSDDYRSLLRDFLRAKYANTKIDVAVAVLQPALEFLLKYGDTIFPGTPIVFCGVDRNELRERSLPPHVRGVLVKRDFAPTLELALGLHPQTKQVTVVAGTSEFDARLLDQAKEEFRVYENRVGFRYLTALPLQKQLAELGQLPRQSIVLFTTLFRDGAGEAFIPHDVVSRVSAAASVPVYGFMDQYLGRGIVGGNLYSFSAHGTEAAKLVLEVLAGRSGPSLLEPSVNKVMFDWRQMQRWGISASSVPARSEIRFREVTPWDQYRDQVLLAGAAILFQAGLIAWLLVERHRRRRAEIAVRDTMSNLAHVNRAATAGELTASIAHEVKQPLAAIVANANAGVRWLAAATPDIGEADAAFKRIITAGHHAGDVVATVRSLFKQRAEERVHVKINDLIQSALSLERIELQKRQVSLRLDLAQGLPDVLGDRVQLTQVILNLIRNAIEAMSADRRCILGVNSQVDKSGDVLVSVEDSGTGIDKENLTRIFEPLFTTKRQGLGIGLSICKSIIESHDGELSVTSAVGEGTTFYVQLPRADGRRLETVRE